MNPREEKQALIDAGNEQVARVLLLIAKFLAVVAVIAAVAFVVHWFQEREQNRMFGVDIVGINHTDYGIDFYVNGVWGSGIGAHSGGGGSVCCLNIPAHYRAGLKVEVTWKSTRDSPTGNAFQTREVVVPPYDANRVGQFSVHFLKSGEIKVLAATTDITHSSYPIRGPL